MFLQREWTASNRFNDLIVYNNLSYNANDVIDPAVTRGYSGREITIAVTVEHFLILATARINVITSSTAAATGNRRSNSLFTLTDKIHLSSLA